MFRLPAFTVAVMIGIPAVWILYTVVFVVNSRRWSKEDDDSDAVISARLPGDDEGPTNVR